MMQIAGTRCYVCGRNVGVEGDGFGCGTCQSTAHRVCVSTHDVCGHCGAAIASLADGRPQLMVDTATLGARLSAQVLDTAFALLVLFTPLIIANRFASGDVHLSIRLGPAFAYILLSDALPGGQSLGKRLLRLAVVDERTGKPCRLIQSFGRNGLQYILGIIDIVFVFGAARRRLGDRLAGTRVIQLPRRQ